MNDESHFRYLLSIWADGDDYNNNKEINQNCIIASIILLNALNCYNLAIVN